MDKKQDSPRRRTFPAGCTITNIRPGTGGRDGDETTGGMMSCEYVREYYGVPAVIGRRVMVSGKPGIIAEDRGHYIGVNFDADKPGVVSNCHPTSNVEYGEMGKVRKPSRSHARYMRFLEYGDGFDSFIDFCRWDAAPERSWNKGTI